MCAPNLKDASRAVLESWKEKFEAKAVSMVISGHHSAQPRGGKSAQCNIIILCFKCPQQEHRLDDCVSFSGLCQKPGNTSKFWTLPVLSGCGKCVCGHVCYALVGFLTRLQFIF